MSQLSHDDFKFKSKTFPITLVLHELTSPANVGSIFRLADALGVKNIILCNCTIDMTASRFKRTSRHTEAYVSYNIESDTVGVLKLLQEENYNIIALEITKDSVAIETLLLEKNVPIAIVVGSERNGIPDAVLAHTSTSAHITMYGTNSSMNVAQAAGIALFQITKTLTS